MFTKQPSFFSFYEGSCKAKEYFTGGKRKVKRMRDNPKIELIPNQVNKDSNQSEVNS